MSQLGKTGSAEHASVTPLHPPATDSLRTEGELDHTIVMSVCNGPDILRLFLRQRPVSLCQLLNSCSAATSAHGSQGCNTRRTTTRGRGGRPKKHGSDGSVALPAAASSDNSEDEQKHDGPDGGGDNRVHNPGANTDTQLR